MLFFTENLHLYCMKNSVILQASANSWGNTHKTVAYLNKDNLFDVVDLKTKNIGFYDYEFKNNADDFLPLITNIVENYDTIVFATPVYWYAMSGILKVFFDRFTDVLNFKSELGFKLRDKNMAMLSNSLKNDRNIGFEIPFIKTANYLKMHYLGDVHAWFTNDEIALDAKNKINIFRKNLMEN